MATVIIAFAVHDILTFEPLPQTLTPENVGAFLELRRHFGTWPGWTMLACALVYLVGGLSILHGVDPSPPPDAGDPA